MAKFERDDSIKLGDEVKDDITGLKGVVIAVCEWLNGCRRLTIQPSALHKGQPVEAQTFDAEQISLVKPFKEPKKAPRRTGGPSIAPKQRSNPSRM